VSERCEIITTKEESIIPSEQIQVASEQNDVQSLQQIQVASE
jgi:hypothetical protein